MRGTHSKLCNDLAVRIWEWAIKRNVWITACFLPGTENTIADHNSRHFNDNVEWMLNKDVFNKLEIKFGAFDLDLFASRLNNQLEQFASWKPDPEALYVDAFSFCWSDIYTYAFPPFSLIPWVLRKLEQDGGQMLLIAPIWTTQAWYPQVASLLTDYPIWLKGQTMQTTTSPPHPDNTSTPPENEHDGLQVVRASLQKQGVSRRTENLLLGSWKGSTKKQYAPYIKQWHQLCLQQGSDPLQPNIGLALDFLADLQGRGLGYSAVNTARSALSSVIISNPPFGSLPLVRRLMRAVFLEKPPKPRYDHSWDTNIVFQLLRRWSPVRSLNLHTLTLKLMTLLALVTAQRTQSLVLLNLDHLKKGARYSFSLPEHIKQSCPTREGFCVTLEGFPPDRRL